MRILSVIFSCGRDADKLPWAIAAIERLGIEVRVVSDPNDPVPGIDPVGSLPISNGVTLFGDGVPQECVSKMLAYSKGYDAVLKVDSDTLVLSRWWEERDVLAEMEGLKRSRNHPDHLWHLSGAAYLIQRRALEAISGHALLQKGAEDEQITRAVRACGMRVFAPLHRFPYPRGLAFWFFRNDIPIEFYEGAKAILFGLRQWAPGKTPEEKEDAITAAMAVWGRERLGLELS